MSRSCGPVGLPCPGRDPLLVQEPWAARGFALSRQGPAPYPGAAAPWVCLVQAGTRSLSRSHGPHVGLPFPSRDSLLLRRLCIREARFSRAPNSPSFCPFSLLSALSLALFSFFLSLSLSLYARRPGAWRRFTRGPSRPPLCCVQCWSQSAPLWGGRGRPSAGALPWPATNAAPPQEPRPVASGLRIPQRFALQSSPASSLTIRRFFEAPGPSGPGFCGGV